VVRVWSNARSASELAALWNKALVLPTSIC
jgi:hypothetical protein